MNRHKGYTLLEVLLVFTLLAGIGYLLIIRIPMAIEDRNLEIATTQMVQVLRDTREKAMAEKLTYTVRFYPNEREYAVRRGTYVRTIKLPKKVEFMNHPEDIEFRPNSTVLVDGKIFLTNGKKRKTIIVALITGRVRVEN